MGGYCSKAKDYWGGQDTYTLLYELMLLAVSYTLGFFYVMS